MPLLCPPGCCASNRKAATSQRCSSSFPAAESSSTAAWLSLTERTMRVTPLPLPPALLLLLLLAPPPPLLLPSIPPLLLPPTAAAAARIGTVRVPCAGRACAIKPSSTGVVSTPSAQERAEDETHAEERERSVLGCLCWSAQCQKRLQAAEAAWQPAGEMATVALLGRDPSAGGGSRAGRTCCEDAALQYPATGRVCAPLLPPRPRHLEQLVCGSFLWEPAGQGQAGWSASQHYRVNLQHSRRPARVVWAALAPTSTHPHNHPPSSSSSSGGGGGSSSSSSTHPR